MSIRLLTLLLCNIVAFGASCAASDLPPPSATELLRAPRPLVIGHRGYSGAAPENTLPSFAAATLAGADLVELDYHPTADGALIVLHDATLDRTTDARSRWGGERIRASEHTLAELQSLDAGRWFDPRFAGTRLPLLAEAIELIAPHAVTLIERKEGDARTCVELLRTRGWINRVVVQSFDWDYLRDFHALAPEQVLAALGPVAPAKGQPFTEAEKTLGPAQLDRLAAAGASVAVWSGDLVTHDSVREAHARGLRVWVYTVNDLPTATRLLALGVDGIISNHPPLIWKALATYAHAP
ncbi:MAG: hypothetical protein KF715_14460 [Candidatus Didemnitutus sp.]|nr:hypothetical protein [Candidatus Didemnitutus sp.]